jgi:hypothetical protein
MLHFHASGDKASKTQVDGLEIPLQLLYFNTMMMPSKLEFAKIAGK